MIVISHPRRASQPPCQETAQRLTSLTQTLCAAIPVLTPYYSQMTFIDCTGLGDFVAAIDQHGRFYYNAERIKEMSNSQLAFVIQHETLHVLMDHPKRVGRFYQLLDQYILDQMGLKDLKNNQIFLRVLEQITSMAIDIEVDHSIPAMVKTPMGDLKLQTTASHEAALDMLRSAPGVARERAMEFNAMEGLKRFAQEVQDKGLIQAAMEFMTGSPITSPEDFMREIEKAVREQQGGGQQRGGQQPGGQQPDGQQPGGQQPGGQQPGGQQPVGQQPGGQQPGGQQPGGQQPGGQQPGGQQPGGQLGGDGLIDPVGGGGGGGQQPGGQQPGGQLGGDGPIGPIGGSGAGGQQPGGQQPGGQLGGDGPTGALDGDGGWKGGLDCSPKVFGHPKVIREDEITDVMIPGKEIPTPPIEDIKRQIAQEILEQEARQANPNDGSKGRGTIPAGLIRHIVEVERPQVDYVREFDEFMQTLGQVGRVQQDLLRPHYLFAAYEALAQEGYFSEPPIPESKIHYSMKLGVLVDTSGSVGDAEVAFARESTAQILNSRKFQNVVLCSVDAGVHFCQEVRRVEPSMLRGNGGTDLVAGFDALLKRDVDAILVFTDQETPWPEYPVPVPVVVVSHRERHPHLPRDYRFFQLSDPQLKQLSDTIRGTGWDSTPSATTGGASPAARTARRHQGIQI